MRRLSLAGLLLAALAWAGLPVVYAFSLALWQVEWSVRVKSEQMGRCFYYHSPDRRFGRCFPP